MISLPSDWITSESLLTFGGMVTAIVIMMIVIEAMGVHPDYHKVLSLSAALILNVVAVTIAPAVDGRAIVIAVVNGFLTFLVAWLAFLVAEPLRAKLRKPL